MSINIAAYAAGTTSVQGGKQASSEKPVWNPNKVYKYLEDMNEGFQSYRKQAVSYYSSLIAKQEGDGSMSVDALKEEIKELFPEYTLTDSEPSKVKNGISYLYIDKSQLQKMASDADYRAKVYGLMDTELQGIKGYTLQYSDGRNVTAHLTGSIFSLAEKNNKYAGPDGIPYLGSCTSDHSVCSSDSHPHVRSMSYLYENLDPAKSAANARKAAATKTTAKAAAKAAEKAAKKKAEQKKTAKKLAEKKQAEKASAKKLSEKKLAEQKAEEAAKEKAEQKNTTEYLADGTMKAQIEHTPHFDQSV